MTLQTRGGPLRRDITVLGRGEFGMVTIPAKLKNLIQGVTDEISAAVGGACASVRPFLKRNEAPFFPDYTDHGIEHVESVLRTSELIIGDQAWEVFSRQDAAVLALATLAHDLGMLINVEGFIYLTDPSRHEIVLFEPDDQPWPKLWREFQLDARRFDAPTLINLLGSPEPVTIQEMEPGGFTERGMRIAGEFLRRHHHRLAHEILVLGMPSESGRLSLFGEVPEYLRELSGIVARSHGIPVRECVEPLKKQDRSGHRECRHVHPVFLMVLVRLADYLDLDIGRAPASILAAKSLRSPISRREWWSHRAIVDCHSLDDDPECLNLVVEPSAVADVATFGVIEDKITGIQQELDSCWAVLGEVYGRFPPLNRLSLKIRRIRSNIRESSILLQLPFVPHRASLESARADLLKLLIEPLYGDHPGIGIRELIQNAIDAVRELDFIVGSASSNGMTVDKEDLDGDVVVYFEHDEKGEYWVVVADQGIGMTWATVCKYYLTAGASFRQSGAWKKTFAYDSGVSKVLLSGRFGIGVLAAFLLGDRVYVSTRHVEESENQGIELQFGLDDTSIEMRWVKRKVGTTVKVRTAKATVERLTQSQSWGSPWERENWDWYCLEKPVLTRLDVKGKQLSPKYKLPPAEGPLPLDWHRIDVPGYQAIDWSYRRDLPHLVCNGILVRPYKYIGDHRYSRQFRPSDWDDHDETCTHLTLESPKLSVFDPDGRLPLNLARSELARSDGELETRIVDDVCRNFIAFCLARGPQGRMVSRDRFASYTRLTYPGWHSSSSSLWPPFGFFFDTLDGWGVSDPWNISHFSSKIGLLIRVSGRRLQVSQKVVDLAQEKYGLTCGVESDGNLVPFDHWHRKLILYSTLECLPAFRGLKLRGLRTLMPVKWYERFCSKQRKFVVKSTQVESKTSDSVTLTVGDCPGPEPVLGTLADDLRKNKISFESITEFYMLPADQHPAPGRIAKLWQEAIGGPIVPFNKGDRQRLATKLPSEFERHLQEWTSSEAPKRTRKLPAR